MIPKTRPRGSELKAELVPAMMFLDEAVESLRIVARQFIRVGSQEGVEPLDQCIIIPPREIRADGRVDLLIQHLVRTGRRGGGEGACRRRVVAFAAEACPSHCSKSDTCVRRHLGMVLPSDTTTTS